MNCSCRCLLSFVVCVFFVGPTVLAQVPTENKNGYPNYDVRDPDLSGNGNDARTASPSRPPRPNLQNKFAPALAAINEAGAALKARVPGLHLEMNRQGSAPEIIGTDSATQFLTAESSAPAAQIARQFVTGEAALFGLTSEQASALVQVSDYTNPAGNMSWVEFRQEANGIPIFQAELRAGFTARGALARTTSNLAPGLDYASLATKPGLTPAEGAARGAASIGWTVQIAKLAEGAKAENDRVTVLGAGPFQRPIRTELVYFVATPGTATLAYAMTLWEPIDAYYILIDAHDGTLLWRKNMTNFQTQGATYNVYTSDSPASLSPTTALPGSGFQAPGIARTSVTLVGNEAPNTFNNLGWITDGNNTTTGNNVDCGLDVVAPDGIETRATGSPNRVFNFSYNPAPLGTDSPSLAASRNGAITNLFYWTNVYHDRLYLLGFTETARNFQTDNFGRGGVGNDAVLAQVQDYSGTNNANFSTPADGGPGRMQMYLFTGPSPARDGSLDADVFLHEMTHGTSNRLHNNGSGLTTNQAGGMGEGWSDFYARGLLSSAAEDVNAVFASGAYATYQLGGLLDNYYYGIRRFPYAVRSTLGANGKSHNPLTLADLDAAQYYLGDGAYPRSPIFAYGSANEVHNVGEFWCMALLEFRARLINRLGFALGNTRALQIVTDAMKLDPTNPTILQARDSIIAAANAGAGGAADALDARIGFATRGAGAGASLSTAFVAVESFLPDLTLGAVTFTDALGNNNGAADPGEDLSLNVPLTNPLTSSNAGVSATVANYKASYGTIAASSSSAQSFAYRVPTGAIAGQLLLVPITVQSAAGTFTVNFPLRIGAPSNALLQNFDSVVAPTLPVGWTTATAAASGGVSGTAWVTTAANTVDAANSAFAPDSAGNGTAGGETSLISPAIAAPTGGSQLSFRHRYAFEFSQSTAWDGGVLEIAIGGGSFTDIIAAGGSFVQTGYVTSISNQGAINPLSARPGFTSTPSAAVTTVINLPDAAAGQSVQFRWRIGFDNSVGATGWNVDTISLTSFNTSTIDSDGDGIPNGYESSHGLNPSDPADASGDLDGDGVSNLDEYRDGTDPQSAASVLRVSLVAYDRDAGVFSLSLPTVNGRLYRIEFNDDLTNPLGWTLLQDNVVGTGGTLVLPETGATGPHLFYRARVLF